jgi:serine/threonine-protein kinase
VQPGDLIDEKYELIRLLGEGAMGSVFEGRHVSIGRRVALKFLHRDHKKEPESLARFMREAQAAASIGSEHIVEVTDIGKTADGTPYLVMEYLEGEDLDRVLEREVRLEPARAANIAVQTCRAVGAAHARGIIHRDLKPANLYVARRADGTEHVKVLDFGIAKFRDSVSLMTPNLTATGMVLGTPYYMPPEQARGAKKADAQSDIYSLGVLMYEMLTGEMPFKGETYNELIVNISTCDPTPVRMIRPELSEGLETVVMKAMARDPIDRYASMDEVAAALLPFTDDPRLASAVSVPATRRVEVMTDPGLELAETMAEPRQARTRRWLLPGVVALGAVAIAAGAAWWLRSAGTSTDSATIVNVAPDAGTSDVPPEDGGQGATRSDAGQAEVAAAHDSGTLHPGDGSLTAPPPRPDTIRIEVRVAPDDAEVLIDGIAVDGNPFVDRFPRDGARHRVEARAHGFQPAAQLVVFDEDRSIDFELQPLRRPVKGKQPSDPLERDNPYGIERSNPYGT